jgi:hypothetical protein
LHRQGITNEWGFKAPEAELIDAQGSLFAKHFAGPTWEAPDGSKAVGKVLASELAPKAGAIPWLLLSTQPFGPGGLAGVRFVQRVNTSGESARPAHVRRPEQSAVSITQTDYIFYK